MKVAIVLNTSWNVYNFRMSLIKALQNENHAIHVIAPADDYTQKIKESNCEFHPVKMDSRGANPIKDMALFFELRSIYKKVQPDIILHFTIKPNIYGTLAAASLKIPCINNVCGLGTVFLQKGIVSTIALLMYKVAFKFPKKVFFQNHHDNDLFIKEKLIKEELCEVIPGSGIDLNHFPPMAFKRNNPFTFLLISRLIYDKGVIEYIDAVKKLKESGINARFQILGAKDPEHKRGIQEDLINDWINSNVIEYLGTTSDVRNFIENADCIVLPSYREGTPRTLLEAASSAKPIIATDVPGCNNVVTNNFNGYLCELKSSEDLALKMNNMCLLPDSDIKNFGLNGRKKVEEEFNEVLVIDSYIKTIAEFNQ
ncbi:glycosyltransferase family 4 protein [Fulvivirga ligni]|uniref:glycosyltransferase family 4 protein n=1 Tax=Fulvivirga ligni TaxID=2904246 RepID=UPI001F43D1A7|nr:glycosyltransferase family 4 protein [Fulvivirga ligni]UII23310.1 glycosyltransferase family 4 protein [Fulvivirga ligni]